MHAADPAIQAISVDKCHAKWCDVDMAHSTRIDAAGRVVIPKQPRQRYGLETGTIVTIVPLPDGVSIVPERRRRRFIRRGPVLSIDTGRAEATAEQFDNDRLREERLDCADPLKQR